MGFRFCLAEVMRAYEAEVEVGFRRSYFDYAAGHDLNFYWPRFSVRYRPFDWTRDG